MNSTFRMARLYVNHCGFSVVPQWYKQKTMMFKGITFQTRPPTPENLKHWFTRKPANIAIVPGAISDNLCILDFDSFDMWSVFHALTGWNGPIVRTGKGIHVYVRVKDLPERNCKGFFEGVFFGDILVRRSITAPPSVHPSGAVYRWIGSPVGLPFLDSLDAIGVECRPWIDTEEPQKREFQKATTRRHSTAPIGNTDAYTSAAIQGECQKILNVAEGDRNRQLYLSALKLSKFTRMIPPDSLASFLESAAKQAGLENAEIRNTIASGFSNGMRNGVL